jgi:Autotransporter beta-domain
LQYPAACAFLAQAVLLLLPADVAAQMRLDPAANLQKRANGVLVLMGYTVVPNVTTGSLAIKDPGALDPNLRMASLGGGFTWQPTPLYVEGTVSATRYDPSFAVSGGQDAALAAKWSTVAATGGIGWDFPIAAELKFRPILNLSMGRLESEAPGVPEGETDRQAVFLRRGSLNVGGVGASLMLDYEHYRPEGEVDAELRYADMRLSSRSGTSEAVDGRAHARSLGLWTRYRAPTGLTAFERPVRYVLEYAVTRFMGDLDGTIGFNVLNSLGAGLEVDSSRYDVFVTRTRLVARYVVGNHVSGWSLGLGITF